MRKQLNTLTIAVILFFCLLCFSCFGKRYKEIDLPSTYYNDDTSSIQIEIPWFSKISDGLFSLIRLYDSIHPEIKVQGLVQADAKMQQKLRRDFSTGAFPDIFASRPSVFIDKLIAEDRVMEVGTIFLENREWFSGFLYKQLWTAIRKQGRTYGFPVLASYGCMVINRDAFTSQELYPRTLSDILALARAGESSKFVLFRVETLNELRQLVSSLMVIYAEGIEKATSPEQLREAFLNSIEFLRELVRLEALEAGPLVRNSRYNFSGRDAALVFIQDISDAYIQKGSRYLYRPYPAHVDPTERYVVFAPGPLTIYVSRDPLRSMAETEYIFSFLKFITFEGSIIYHNINEYLVNIKTDPLDKDKFFKSPEVAEQYSYLLNEGSNDMENLLLEDFKPAGDESLNGLSDLRPELIGLLETSKHISLPPEYFHNDILDSEFLLGIAELLVNNADPGELWDKMAKSVPEFENE